MHDSVDLWVQMYTSKLLPTASGSFVRRSRRSCFILNIYYTITIQSSVVIIKNKTLYSYTNTQIILSGFRTYHLWYHQLTPYNCFYYFLSFACTVLVRGKWLRLGYRQIWTLSNFNNWTVEVWAPTFPVPIDWPIDRIADKKRLMR